MDMHLKHQVGKSSWSIHGRQDLPEHYPMDIETEMSSHPRANLQHTFLA